MLIPVLRPLGHTIRRNWLRMGLVTVVVAVVAAATVYQGQIEAGASVQLQQAESSLAAEVVHAGQIGLTPEELAPYLAAKRDAESKAPPLALLFFNTQRISFYEQNRRQAAEHAAGLRELEAAVTARTRDEATAAAKNLNQQLARATELNADPEEVAPLAPAVQEVQTALDRALLPKEYRPLKARAQEVSGQLETLVRKQDAENARIAQLAAEAAAQNAGDLAAARRRAQDTLADARFDLQTADLFKVEVGRLRWRVDQAAELLQRAQNTGEVERADAALRLRDASIMAVLEANAPEKAITISLREQRLRAFSHGNLVWASWVTTGRPGLETDIGNWKVLRKNSPWKMQSPWPKLLPDGKPNPWWYEDTPVKTVMWFTDSGEGIHDASWRGLYGPGTNFPHGGDPRGATNGTHGCVNVPENLMPWLWDWTPVGTPVIVY
jgi:lipoprotein-anchoring transpeptidase ErfK/SrfK